MNRSVTEHPSFTVTLTAHEDSESRLLMATLEVADVQADVDPGVNTAIVIDRSGSMSGQPIEITKAAVARLVRSLGPKDRVGVVAYGDEVEIVSGMTQPDERLAQQVERIEIEGCTNLYGGWLAGAKIVGDGGRVVLLSDGLANRGRFTHARDLAEHAGISYRRFRVTTSTIGVGDAYDEALMAGMAREGGGSHYFAQNVDAVMEAFSRERFAMGAVALQQVSLRYQGQTLQLGHLFGGERKTVVLRVNGLGGEPPTLRFTERATGETATLPLRLPEGFGHDDEVTLEWLFMQVAEVEDEVLSVRDPRSATQAKERVRQVLLKLLAHPKSEEEYTQSVIHRLEDRIARLDQLAREYDEASAMLERKRAAQASYNTRDPGKAYSYVAAERPAMDLSQTRGTASAPDMLIPNPNGLALAPIERWREWLAVPVEFDGQVLRLAMANPKDGFKVSEIEKATGVQVRPYLKPYKERMILKALH